MEQEDSDPRGEEDVIEKSSIVTDVSEDSRLQPSTTDMSQEFEEEIPVVPNTSNEIIPSEKSSPFHGFSTQSEAEDTSTSLEVPDHDQVRAKMCEDFGLGQENSDEDTEGERETSGDADDEQESSMREEALDIVSTGSVLNESKKVSLGTEMDTTEGEESIAEASDQKENSKEEQNEMDTSQSMEAEEPVMSPFKVISPKKVHFSDEVEETKMDQDNQKDKDKSVNFMDNNNPKESINIPVLEDLEEPPEGGSTPKAKRDKSGEREKGVSPPLKLKIKFGKDKTGAITHCKIKNKHYSSSDEKEEEEDKEIIELNLPSDPDTPFHGFPQNSMKPWVFNNYEEWDLKTNFRIRPTVFVSISSKKNANKSSASNPSPSVTIKPPVAPASKDAKDSKSSGRVSPTVSPETPKLAAALRGELGRVTITPASVKDKKKMTFKDHQYIKPLLDGWVRELVWRAPTAGRTCLKSDADVYYYPPDPTGQKKKFRSANELEGYLITSGSMFPMTFFTFKKEPVGGPEGSEIIRDSVNTSKKADVKTSSTSDGIHSSHVSSPLVLGKRVSKPPEKLVAETEDPVVTPSRSSKRVIRPPGKYDQEEPPAKIAKVEVERRVSSSTKDLTQNSQREENIATSPKKTVTNNKTAGSGLKLKMFSKMAADSKNQHSSSGEVTEKSSDAPVSDIIMVEGEAETAPAPQPQKPVPPQPQQPVGPAMTITKVKKPPGFPQGTMITLPGHPTTGPPPRSYSQPHQPPPRLYNQAPVQAPGSSISITPLGSQARHGPGQSPTVRNLKPAPKILRPSRPTQLPCSIHCPGVTGFPSLSCTSCHCLFHPKCVGLPPGLGTSIHHQFYCNDCNPSCNPSPIPPSLSMVKEPTVPTSQKPPPVLPKSQPDNGKENLENRSQPKLGAAKPKVAQSRVPPPPSPFPGQMMVNIAGRKFLVTPHPAPAPTLESPPPSPPLLAVRGIAPVPPQGGDAASRRAVSNIEAATEKLNVLLRPVEGGNNIPSFEVEQTPDGKFLLVPYDRRVAGDWPGNKKERRNTTEIKKGITTQTWGNNFTNNLSGGYHAMMQVFRYLSVRERLQASSVCKLWRDIALNHSLWRTVSLKNTRVYSWAGFGQFLSRIKATHLDVRKMLFVKEREATWQEIVSIAENFSGLKKLELPKIEGSVLAQLATACPKLESLHAPLVCPPLDIDVIGKMTGLKEIRLKASAASSIRVPDGLGSLASLAPTLTHLSLLTLDGLKEADFDVFGTLVHVQLLEIGDCSGAPRSLFKTLSDLTRLQRLRLERGSVGDNVGKLANAPALKQLELIDFTVTPGFKSGLKIAKNIRKMLIIPSYQDEVAKINSEIIQGVTEDMTQLEAFYLGVTNEWLEAMSVAMGISKGSHPGGEKECFPLERNGQVEHISLPALYRLVCREMGQGCKVKVLKMSAQATCKQFIANLDQS